MALSTCSTSAPFEAGPKGERIEIDVPDDKKPVLDELYDALKESVAETSEELMDKYFSGEDFTYAEMIQGLRQGVKDLSLFPVVCGSAVSGLGTRMLLDIIVELLPSPWRAAPSWARTPTARWTSSCPSPAPARRPGVEDRLRPVRQVLLREGHLRQPQARHAAGQFPHRRHGEAGPPVRDEGKKAEEVKELECGDIGASARWRRSRPATPSLIPARCQAGTHPLPRALLLRAITPKTKGQEDKIAQGLARMNEEDPTFSVTNNAETHQMVLNGSGDMQVDVLVSKLKSRFNVETELKTPRVPYREKIRKTVSKQGRHKKQTGGSGQFGDVWIRFEPNFDQEEMVFAEEVFGGSVPKNFFPAVEKGLREACSMVLWPATPWST